MFTYRRNLVHSICNVLAKIYFILKISYFYTTCLQEFKFI